MKPRIPPLTPEQWFATNEAVVEILKPKDDDGMRVPSHLTRTLAHHPDLANAFYGLGRHLLEFSTLPARERELMTLRVAWRYQSDYEWSHHVPFARVQGITDAQIEAVKHAELAPSWSELDRLHLAAVDQMCAQARLDDATWNGLASHYNRQQMLDLVFTIAQYIMLSAALGALRVEVEPAFQSVHPSLR